MCLPAVTGQLAGQIPLITMAGVTVKYKEAMLGGRPARRKRKPRAKARSRRSSFGRTSPF